MGFTYEEAMDRLECPHTNCNYYEVVTEISATYVEGKLTIEKSCRNCNGRDHLMFELGSYKTTIDGASTGDRFKVKDNLRLARASEGDTLTITAIAENPRAIDAPAYAGDQIIIGVTRNLETDSKYRCDTLNPDRLKTLLKKEKIEPIQD